MSRAGNPRTSKHPPMAAGQRYGCLVSVMPIDRDRWIFRCDCSIEKVMWIHNVRRGASKTCGKCSQNGRVRHGGTGSREYKSWEAMKYRCADLSNSRYGGRGIKVCDRWRNSFEAFYEDMGPRPVGTSLDRYPNQNGDYEPGNCRWATPKEQNSNSPPRRQLVEYADEVLPLQAWARRFGVSRRAIGYRLKSDPRFKKVEG